MLLFFCSNRQQQHNTPLDVWGPQIQNGPGVVTRLRRELDALETTLQEQEQTVSFQEAKIILLEKELEARNLLVHQLNQQSTETQPEK